MGLIKPYLNFIETSIEQVFGGAKNLRMLELGDQIVREPSIPEETGKAYFENRGFEHISIDINGLHGALVRDLRKPEQFTEWHGTFDVITNAGTTEHVEPFETQYECFGILHDCVKAGGVIIHLNPDVNERDERGKWRDHCRNYYSKAFYDMLAKECEYELLSNTVINGLRCAAVKKIKDVPFMSDRAKFLSGIAQRKMAIRPIRVLRERVRRLSAR